MWVLQLLASARGFVALPDAARLTDACVAEHEWLRAFNATQAAVLAGGPMRAVVVRPHRLAGVGNRIRAIQAALFVARHTSRVVVVENDDHLTRMLRPRLVQWDERAWPAPARARLEAADAQIVGRNAKLQPADLVKNVVVFDAWNDDPSSTWRSKWGVENEAATEASCATVALFRLSATLSRELHQVQMTGHAALHVRTNAEFEDRLYVKSRLERRRERRPHAALDESCDGASCWARVGARFKACARGLVPDAPLFVASDDHDLVTALQSEGVRSLPRSVRSHSGLLRPNASNVGPFLDLFLVASAAAIVGTAGSSFSSLALALGGFKPMVLTTTTNEKLLRPAVLFRTPFLKGPAASDKRAIDLPHSDVAAAQLCDHFRRRYVLPELH